MSSFSSSEQEVQETFLFLVLQWLVGTRQSLEKIQLLNEVIYCCITR